jgi:hypothetical protein
MVLDGKELPKKRKFFPAAVHGTLGRPRVKRRFMRSAQTFRHVGNSGRRRGAAAAEAAKIDPKSIAEIIA